MTEKLRSVLADPEAMARIASIAGNIAGSGERAQEETNAPGAAADSGTPPALPAVRDPRVALLYSLKPLLREEKREKVDSLAKALSAVSMFKNFRK